MGKTHGQQMGTSGFGLTHGYTKDDEVDRNISHEFKSTMTTMSVNTARPARKTGTKVTTGGTSASESSASGKGGKVKTSGPAGVETMKIG